MIVNAIKNIRMLLSDRLFIKLMYRYHIGKWPNLSLPKTYNEKLQWLKLHDRRPEYICYVDKYIVRKYIKDTIGEKYLIPLLGVYNDVDQIDWTGLPNQFVLKCTHGSGSNIICTNKDKLDIDETRIKLRGWMKKNWYWYGREWPYKNVKPRIVCEKYMVDESGIELKDYKIFCFNGEPKLIQVDFNRFFDHKRNLYTTDWQFIDVSIKRPNLSTKDIPKPQKLLEMLNCARMLSENIPHVRVDFYSIDDDIYFGEMTFFHGSGFESFNPEEFGEIMGGWIELPGVK